MHINAVSIALETALAFNFCLTGQFFESYYTLVLNQPTVWDQNAEEYSILMQILLSWSALCGVFNFYMLYFLHQEHLPLCKASAVVKLQYFYYIFILI